MIVRTLDEITDTERVVNGGNWISRRLLLADDNMGISVHDTLIQAGTETLIGYKHHLEAVYCIQGEGEVETLADEKVYPIKPGTLYALDRHDRHLLRAHSEMRLVSIFNPALTGREIHDESGSYPPPNNPDRG